MTFSPAIGTRTQTNERYRSAPIAGVNRVDNTRALDRGGFAQVIDNYVCRPDGLVVRPGYENIIRATGAVTALMTYPSQVIYRTDGDWIGETMANAGGQHLLAAKGDAAPIRYNGTTWDTPAITGVDASTIDGIIQHNGRFFGFLSGDLEVVYLPLRAFSGQAEVIPMHALFSKGGSIVAIGSMTNDGGEMGGDSLVAVTDQGQLAIYDGYDPEFADRWRLRGVYDVPRPAGRRCLNRAGGRLNLLTEKGLLDIPGSLPLTKSQRATQPMTRNIGPIAGAVSSLESAAQEIKLIHAGDEQWVQDPETQGWSRWLNLGATCWAEAPDGLYFGKSNGSVCKMGAGLTDGGFDVANQLNFGDLGDSGGVSIGTVIVDAFTQYGTPRSKTFHRVRPHHDLTLPYRARMELITNYRAAPGSWIANNINRQYWTWPEISYGMMPASWVKQRSSAIGDWRGIAGQGDAVALVYGTQFLGTESTFIGYDIEFEGTAGR